MNRLYVVHGQAVWGYYSQNNEKEFLWDLVLKWCSIKVSPKKTPKMSLNLCFIDFLFTHWHLCLLFALKPTSKLLHNKWVSERCTDGPAPLEEANVSLLTCIWSVRYFECVCCKWGNLGPVKPGLPRRLLSWWRGLGGLAQGSVALRSQITSEPDSSAPHTPTRHTLLNGVLTRILAQTGLANTYTNSTKVTFVLQAMDIKLSEQLSTLRYTLARIDNTQTHKGMRANIFK